MNEDRIQSLGHTLHIPPSCKSTDCTTLSILLSSTACRHRCMQLLRRRAFEFREQLRSRMLSSVERSLWPPNAQHVCHVTDRQRGATTFHFCECVRRAGVARGLRVCAAGALALQRDDTVTETPGEDQGTKEGRLVVHASWRHRRQEGAWIPLPVPQRTSDH